MNNLYSWAERIAEREGDYLSPDDLQNLIRYSLSFQERLDLYQVFQQQEVNWIEKVIHPPGSAAAPDLSPAQILLARHLAWGLRSLGLSLLLGDPLPLQHLICGAMEQHLGLPEALERLWPILQGSLSAEQQDWVAPYWQLLQAAYARSAAHVDLSSGAEVAEPDSAPEPAPTLMEMFV